jgi:hypothetical protein
LGKPAAGALAADFDSGTDADAGTDWAEVLAWAVSETEFEADETGVAAPAARSK